MKTKIGAKVKEKRHFLKWSQERLAAEIKKETGATYTRQAVHMLEKGESGASVVVVGAIVQIFRREKAISQEEIYQFFGMNGATANHDGD